MKLAKDMTFGKGNEFTTVSPLPATLILYTNVYTSFKSKTIEGEI
jgi:hypothetical protein